VHRFLLEAYLSGGERDAARAVGRLGAVLVPWTMAVASELGSFRSS